MIDADRTDENSVKINIRAARHQRDLIDRAAQVTGKTRTEFMLETACRAPLKMHFSINVCSLSMRNSTNVSLKHWTHRHDLTKC
jgi:uncharacterized protein (DUF1778 family)